MKKIRMFERKAELTVLLIRAKYKLCAKSWAIAAMYSKKTAILLMAGALRRIEQQRPYIEKHNLGHLTKLLSD